jgi:hypothetical protein
MNTGQIWGEYDLVADKHFVGSLVDNKNNTDKLNKLAFKFSLNT